MNITFKSKAQQKRFLKIYNKMFFEKKDVKQNGFNDILINISNYNIQESELEPIIDNKFIFYNKNRKIISIS